MKENLLEAFQALVECYDQLLSERDGRLTDEQQSYVRMMQHSAVRLPGMFEGSRNENDMRLTLIYDCAAPFAQHLQGAGIFLEGMLGDICEDQRKHFQRIQSISRELLELRANLVVAHRQER
jgi:hypothetical protein